MKKKKVNESKNGLFTDFNGGNIMGRRYKKEEELQTKGQEVTCCNHLRQCHRKQLPIYGIVYD